MSVYPPIPRHTSRTNLETKPTRRRSQQIWLTTRNIPHSSTQAEKSKAKANNPIHPSQMDCSSLGFITGYKIGYPRYVTDPKARGVRASVWFLVGCLECETTWCCSCGDQEWTGPWWFWKRPLVYLYQNSWNPCWHISKNRWQPWQRATEAEAPPLRNQNRSYFLAKKSPKPLKQSTTPHAAGPPARCFGPLHRKSSFWEMLGSAFWVAVVCRFESKGTAFLWHFWWFSAKYIWIYSNDQMIVDWSFMTWRSFCDRLGVPRRFSKWFQQFTAHYLKRNRMNCKKGQGHIYGFPLNYNYIQKKQR